MCTWKWMWVLQFSMVLQFCSFAVLQFCSFAALQQQPSNASRTWLEVLGPPNVFRQTTYLFFSHILSYRLFQFFLSPMQRPGTKPMMPKPCQVGMAGGMQACRHACLGFRPIEEPLWQIWNWLLSTGQKDEIHEASKCLGCGCHQRTPIEYLVPCYLDKRKTEKKKKYAHNTHTQALCKVLCSVVVRWLMRRRRMNSAEKTFDCIFYVLVCVYLTFVNFLIF